MAFHRLAVSVLVALTISSSDAFAPGSLKAARTNNALRMVATTPADLGIGTDVSNGEKDENGSGAMMDLTGITFSVSIEKLMGLCGIHTTVDGDSYSAKCITTKITIPIILTLRSDLININK